MSNGQSVLSTTHLEDVAPYAIPIVVALAGFNWSSLVPGTNNPFIVAAAFGFLAKFLVGIQQNGLGSWEDLIPTITISLGFLATTLSSSNDPTFLAYGTGIGFLVKSLGYFVDKSHPIEDALLAVGSFLTLWGVYSGHAGVASAGALLSLVGKTIPSLAPASAPTPAPTPAPAPSA